MYKPIIYFLMFLIAFSFVCNKKTFAQKTTKKPTPESIQIPAIVQITSNTDSLYAEYDNEINILIPAPVNIYEITVSQGTIRNNYDKATSIDRLNILSDLKTGSVTITIFCNKNGKKQIAKQRIFGVKEKLFPQYPRHITPYLGIQPQIRIKGYDSVITVSALRNATKIEINKPYSILKYTFLFGNNDIQFEPCT